MLCRKKLSPRRRKARRIGIALLALTVLLTAFYELAVKAQLRDVIVLDMRRLAQKSIMLAADDYLAGHPEVGRQLSDIVYNSGSVSCVSVNAAAVNAVKTEIAQKTQAYIDELSHSQGVSAHLGSFTGLVLLRNIGPEVSFGVDSTQAVSCEFESSFDSAGVNQTVHHISMTVSVELLVYNPFRIQEAVTACSTFEIAQTVIVGAVPAYGGVVRY